MKKCYIAIDIGASGGRHIAGWLEDDKLQLQEIYRFENGPVQKAGHLIWDVDALFAHIVAGLKKAKDLDICPVSIGIDTWAVDFVLLDEAGKRLGEAVSYRDHRTQGMDEKLQRVISERDHYARAGLQKQPFNTVYQLMAVLKEHPEYADTVEDFLLVPEYLSYKLTGKKAHEWTNVSTTALCDAKSRSWSETIIRAAGLPEKWFRTPIVQPGAALGNFLPEIAAQVGYDAEVTLPATHDTGSAYMAVPARDDQAAFLSSGTWSLLGTELRQPVTGTDALAAGFTNEGGYDGTARFLKNIMGMWMLQCIHKEIGEVHSFAQMAQMAARSTYPACVNATDNRFLAPDNMLEEVKQALKDAGAPQPKEFADILRAVTMGLAVCYRDAIAEMSSITGKTFTSVNIVGGGSQNLVLNQMTADLTGLPVYAGPTEGTALGNLASQMIAAGEFATLADFRKALPESFDILTFEPKEEK